MTTKPIDKMTARQIIAHYEALENKSHAYTRQLIEAGYSHKTYREMVAHAKSTGETMPVLWLQTERERIATRDEIDRRVRWHGTPKPIKGQ